MLKNDRWIIEMAEKGMIAPFDRNQVRKGVISYGVSSYGYDMRLFDEFKVFDAKENAVIDPKNFAETHFADFKGDVCTMPPNSYVLGRSLEYFRIPRDVLLYAWKINICAQELL